MWLMSRQWNLWKQFFRFSYSLKATSSHIRIEFGWKCFIRKKTPLTRENPKCGSLWDSSQTLACILGLLCHWYFLNRSEKCGELGCGYPNSYLCIWAPGHTLHYDGLVLLFNLKPIVLLIRMDLYTDKRNTISAQELVASQNKCRTEWKRTCYFQDSIGDLAALCHTERAAAFVKMCEQAMHPAVQTLFEVLSLFF